MAQPTQTNSLEVRWFREGSPPDAVRAWFADLGSVDAGSRTDRYLAPPSPSFNLKLRDEGASVEAKRRLGPPVSRSFANGVAGRVEQWYKWSFPLEGRSGLEKPDPTGLWVPVEKTRLLYALDGTDGPLSDRPDDLTAHVELTEVTAPEGHAWTVGVEVSGPVADLEPAFEALSTELFGGAFPVTFTEGRSFGYAAWLAQNGADGTPDPTVLVPSQR
jgi:hypothetical protein